MIIWDVLGKVRQDNRSGHEQQAMAVEGLPSGGRQDVLPRTIHSWNRQTLYTVLAQHQWNLMCMQTTLKCTVTAPIIKTTKKYNIWKVGDVYDCDSRLSKKTTPLGSIKSGIQLRFRVKSSIAYREHWKEIGVIWAIRRTKGLHDIWIILPMTLNSKCDRPRCP